MRRFPVEPDLPGIGVLTLHGSRQLSGRRREVSARSWRRLKWKRRPDPSDRQSRSGSDPVVPTFTFFQTVVDIAEVGAGAVSTRLQHITVGVRRCLPVSAISPPQAPGRRRTRKPTIGALLPDRPLGPTADDRLGLSQRPVVIAVSRTDGFCHDAAAAVTSLRVIGSVGGGSVVQLATLDTSVRCRWSSPRRHDSASPVSAMPTTPGQRSRDRLSREPMPARPCRQRTSQPGKASGLRPSAGFSQLSSIRVGPSLTGSGQVQWRPRFISER